MKKLITVLAIGGVTLGAALSGAMALPKYTQKEKMACRSCHVKPSGGLPLNDRGKYYLSHSHSLKGFGAPAAAKPAPAPAAAKPAAVPAAAKPAPKASANTTAPKR